MAQKHGFFAAAMFIMRTQKPVHPSKSGTQMKAISPRAMTASYIVALLLIAGLSVVSHIALEYALQSSKGSAATINQTGRQRMLSQRIAGLAAQFRSGDVSVRDDLETAISAFETNHNFLVLDSRAQPLSDSAAKQLQTLYFGAPDPLDARVRNFVRDARRIAELTPDDPALAAPLQRLFGAARSSLLSGLEQVVNIEQIESERRIIDLEYTQWSILSIVLITLTLEAIMIFRPMIRKIVLSTSELCQARDEAQAANRVKSTFLATMSHEIRTPMNGIIAMADDLLGKITDPQLREQVEIITTSGAHLLRIINDILDLSKLDAKKLHFENVPFDIRAVINSASEVFGIRAQKQGVDIKISLSENMPALVVGDGVRLRQILLNLVSNAVKFTPNGEIDINVVCKNDSAAEHLVFEFIIKDTGIGMSEETLSHLFSEFWQADSSISRRYGGTGLGLAVCSRLIRAMRGTIAVASEPDVGTTIAFSVPFERAPLEAFCRPERCATCEDAQEANFFGRRILLVEDNPTNRQIAKIILAKTGARIDTANDGREAVEAASTTQYDLILMDVHMPNMNGIEAAKAIRALAEPLRSVPIVALSASALPEERELCLEAGMGEFMSKPYRGDTLRAAIARALCGPKAASEQEQIESEPMRVEDPAFHAGCFKTLAEELTFGAHFGGG